MHPGKSPEEKYPNLAKLLKSPLYRKEVRKPLQTLLVCDKDAKVVHRTQKLRDKFTKRLEAITGSIADSASLGIIDPVVEKTPEEDFSAHANILYDVLSRYSVCRDSGAEAEIIPKISLKGYQKHSESGSTFHVLFPGHPHEQGIGPSYQWQTSVVQVPTEV